MPPEFLFRRIVHAIPAGRLPLWAEEAAAIGFSGELKSQPISGPPTESELDHLREKVRVGAGLDAAGYGALSKLTSIHGWPSEAFRLLTSIVKDAPLAVTLATQGSAGRGFSTCGRLKIVSSARGSRSERWVSGLLQSASDGDAVVLETDPETYADAVLSAEAQDLQGEAQKALGAAIVWNGVYGSHRHPDTGSLCDTTHCMVFQGQTSEGAGKPRPKPTFPFSGCLMKPQRKKNWTGFLFPKAGSTDWKSGSPPGS